MKMTKEKIDSLVNGIVDSRSIEDDKDFEKRVYDLVNRVQFPDNYCEKCEGRLFFSGGKMVCEECVEEYTLTNASSQVVTNVAPAHTSTAPGRNEPVVERKGGKVVFSGGSKADVIRAASQGSSSQPVTPVPGEVLPGATSNDVNWI